MKYRKGTQTEKLEDLDTLKIRLVRDGNGEGIWVKQGPNYVVLQNHALHFLPFQSWGVVLPSRPDPNSPYRETIDVSHMTVEDGLELHPDAWKSYVGDRVINEEGDLLDS